MTLLSFGRRLEPLRTAKERARFFRRGPTALTSFTIRTPTYPVMRMLHDPAVRQEMERRLATLRPDSRRQWGSMTPDQMLWHLCQFLEFALGEGRYPRGKMPLPLPIMRFMVLYGPWPKNAPTHPSAKAQATHDFEAERKRCLALIDRFVSKPLDEPWPEDAAWGKAGGRFASKLQARHFHHHLSQFGA